MHLENAGIIRMLHVKGKSLNTLDKPEKLYLDNPNLMQALSGTAPDTGSIRETFFLSCFEKDEITFPEKGGVTFFLTEASAYANTPTADRQRAQRFILNLFT